MKSFESCCKAYQAVETEIATYFAANKADPDSIKELDQLKQKRYEVVSKALKLLGEEMGEVFNLLTSGPLDERIADVLSQADLLRKTLLDGMGYVDIVDPTTLFATGFYGTTKLEKTQLFADLKRCTEHRNGSRLSAEERVRLGFDEDIGNESR